MSCSLTLYSSMKHIQMLDHRNAVIIVAASMCYYSTAEDDAGKGLWDAFL